MGIIDKILVVVNIEMKTSRFGFMFISSPTKPVRPDINWGGSSTPKTKTFTHYKVTTGLFGLSYISDTTFWQKPVLTNKKRHKNKSIITSYKNANGSIWVTFYSELNDKLIIRSLFTFALKLWPFIKMQKIYKFFLFQTEQIN